MNGLKKTIFVVLGVICVAVGIAGVFLPLVPATPFLILAGFFFSRSSKRMHDWLVKHRHIGPLIRDWEKDRSIPLYAKILALCMLATSATIIAMRVSIPIYGRGSAIVFFILVGVFIVTRKTAR